MRFREKGRRRRILINITSLIDVLFLLLIFLMVSSTFLEQPGIKLDLPEAESARLENQREAVLFVDGEGRVFLNDREVAMEELEDALRDSVARTEEATLTLKADRVAVYGTVVRVMDIARRSGVSRLVVATRMKSPDEQGERRGSSVTGK